MGRRFTKNTCLVVIFFWNFQTLAQEVDSLVVPKDTLITNSIDSVDTDIQDTLQFKPKRAALLSAVVPGLGQLYNKQIYKTPIYPGAMVLSFSTYLAYRNSFKTHSDSLSLLSRNLIPEEAGLRNTHRIQQAQSRKRANAALAATCFFYAANVIDAYASAHIKNRKVKGQHSPGLAAYRSAAFPGLGQIYNKQYWKVPMVWGALAGAGAFVAYTYQRRKCYGDVYLNRIRYNYYDEALIDKCFSSPIEEQRLSNADLLNLREFHKNNFEWSLIAMGAVYALNIADAIVFSHLRNFDIDDDLGISVKPFFQYQPNDANFTGISMVLTL